jgi:beta-lactamase superfamily II metal-dependent hydrolase
MNCEVEFLPVGDASKAGDAIVIRFGEPEAYELMLVDGGTLDTGEAIVTHLRAQFGSSAYLSHMVLTHADADHASGLRKVLEEVPTTNLWLHIPWLHAEEALPLFRDKRWTVAGLTKAIKDEYAIISEIVDLALEKGCAIHFPAQGTKIGPFTVLAPNRTTYNYLLPQFDRTPAPDQEAIEAANMWIGKPNLLGKLMELASKAAEKWTTESWNVERLRDGGVTSASNESSIILYADLGVGRRLLLTGDAGVNALWWAHGYAQANGLPLQQFSFVQVPHHGSRRNVGPSVLDALLGPKEPQATNRFVAFVSAPKDDSSHPRKIVLNAFMRRGGKVIITQGTKKVHWGGFVPRVGYAGAEAAAFSATVEDYD